MPQSLDMKVIEQRLHQATLQDGLTEFLFGVFLIAAGLVSIVNEYLLLLAVVTCTIWIPALQRVLQSLKEHYVYPRMGFVSLRNQPVKPIDNRHAWLGMGLMVLYMFLFLLNGIVMGRGASQFAVTLTIIPLAVWIVFMAYRHRLIRWYGFGALTLVSGLAVLFIPNLQDPTDNYHIILGIVLAGLGIVASLTGLLIFLHFVRTNPPFDQEVPDDSV